MSISIRKRLLIGLLTLVTISCSIAVLKNYDDTRAEIQELFDAQLAQSARVLLELSAHELHEQLAYSAQLGNDVSEHIPTQVHKYQQEIDFQIWVNGERLAVRSEKAPEHAFIEVDDVFDDRSFDGRRWRVYSTSSDDKVIMVQVGQPYEERQLLSDTISKRLITSFAIMLPILAVFILIIVGRAMAPLRKIASQIENRQYDNLQPICMKTVPVEAQPIVKSLNSLFSRLQIAFDNIILFTANAAHELRTPLAAQKLHAQVAMQTEDAYEREEALSEVVLGVNKATTLVEQLLTLSRLDPESHLSRTETANLAKVAEANIADITPVALAKDIDISLNQQGPSIINGRASLLAVLVRNLVENAIRYTPYQGKVEVAIAQEGSKVALIVSDSGPGIPPEEYHKVFQRFYRAKNNTVDEGTGLGLAMVYRIVEIHNAQIQLGRSNLGGLKVTVLFNSLDIASSQSRVKGIESVLH